MKKVNLAWVFLLLICLAQAVQAGTLEGRVIADRKTPVRAATVYIEGAKGLRLELKTDSQGRYLAKYLPDDHYTIWLQRIDGLETDVPECGYYDGFLEGTSQLDFNLRTTGVIIDFGDPTGPGLVALSDPSQIDFSLFMYNLDEYDADSIDILGYWYIPGQGKLDATVIGGWPDGVYSGSSLMVGYENLLGLLTHYTLRYDAPIDLDGQLATFRLKLSPVAVTKLAQAKGKLAFCGVWVRMYRRGLLVYDSTTNWVGNQADLGQVPLKAIRR